MTELNVDIFWNVILPVALSLSLTASTSLSLAHSLYFSVFAYIYNMQQ